MGIRVCVRCAAEFEGRRCGPCCVSASRAYRQQKRERRIANAPVLAVEVNQAMVRDLFDYDPETGVLTRRKTTNSSAVKGTVAGYLSTTGYLKLRINKQFWAVHRVAWLYVHGDIPATIDHINGNRIDNRIANLRSCTVAENCQNRKPTAGTTSGLKGVSWSKQAGKWIARIYADRKLFALGAFDTKEAAHDAYREAAEKMHKEFARTE